MIDHETIRDVLLEDIAVNANLEARRAAIENYSLFIDAMVKFDANYDQNQDWIPEDEIDQQYLAVCTGGQQ